MKKISWSLISGMLIYLFLLNITALAGTPTFGFKLENTSKNITASRGSEVTLKFYLKNQDADRDIKLVFEYSTLTEPGKQPMPATWFSLATNEVSIATGKDAIVEALISIPENAEAGSYAGVLDAKLVDYTGMDKTAGDVKFSPAIGNDFTITIPSETEVSSTDTTKDNNPESLNTSGDTVQTSSSYSLYFGIFLLVLVILMGLKIYSLESKITKKK